jgi:hypothetical protein
VFVIEKRQSLLVVEVSILGLRTCTWLPSTVSTEFSGGSGPNLLANRLTGATTVHACPTRETAQTNCWTNTFAVDLVALG